MVEGILDPYPSFYEMKNPKDAEEKPHAALVRDNQRIGNEAAEVLYGRNVWQISYKMILPGLTRHGGLERVGRGISSSECATLP